MTETHTRTTCGVDEVLSYSDDEVVSSFEAEDRRWTLRAQTIDWLILATMIVVSLGYHLTIFALQPGLR
ncbi:MAG TPA: hypothetical protein ENH55_10800 [Aurantimonas coralicida]|uniref:Uncharacterized protein n=2 Tax=root TaxID=1 RepID=A0A9C9NCF4_9HYPH|nr:hypothetical protein [Aurantimonas coralicida]HET99449.1 hypothetical protein [Aurantimonas coralicida]